jgi:hypothetical protein
VTDVYIEQGGKRSFACAYEWPGWCRSGKDEATAVAALREYAPRYAAVLKKARIPVPDDLASLRVVERIGGSATTDFGVPGEVARRDTNAVSAEEAKRLGALVNASWATFDAVVRTAPAELRKGPRGGGRDRDKMARHVLDAEGAYVRKLGLRVNPPALGDRDGIAAFRKAIIAVLAKTSNGKPLVEKGWPQRYAARRIAWHALDHAWEMQDRSDTPAR